MSYEIMKWRRQDLIALRWHDNLKRPVLLEERKRSFQLSNLANVGHADCAQ
jgi:hypothetical protein